MRGIYIILGLLGLVSGYAEFLYIFVSAFVSDGTIPANINRIGEMHIEAGMLIILFPFVCIFVYNTLRRK